MVGRAVDLQAERTTSWNATHRMTSLAVSPSYCCLLRRERAISLFLGTHACAFVECCISRRESAVSGTELRLVPFRSTPPTTSSSPPNHILPAPQCPSSEQSFQPRFGPRARQRLRQAHARPAQVSPTSRRPSSTAPHPSRAVPLASPPASGQPSTSRTSRREERSPPSPSRHSGLRQARGARSSSSAPQALSGRPGRAGER